MEEIKPFLPNNWNTYFLSLPGHGDYPPPSDTAPIAWTEALVDFFNRQEFPNSIDCIIGESIAGILALFMSDLPQFQDVPIALLDSPFSTGKLIYVRVNFLEIALSDHPFSVVAIKMAKDLFGYDFTGGFDREILYFSALKHSNSQKLIISGDMPLWPLRKVQGVPCCIDAIDEFIFKDFPRLEFSRITNADHVVLRRKPTVVGKLIEEWLGRLDSMTI